MQKLAMIFCCKGLGDGLISCTLSYNLASAGWKVVFYHPFLQQLQLLLPWQTILPFPKGQDMQNALEQADAIFFFYEKSKEMQEPLSLAQSLYRHKTTILNPIATQRKDHPFWEEGRFDGGICFVDNLLKFCSETLGIRQPQRSAGIILASRCVQGQYNRRVVIHPTSSREGKNWPWHKYCRVAAALEKQGYDPVFILTKAEKIHIPDHCFGEYVIHDLEDLAGFIYESFAMIGNDSGIGHLASALGLRTLTICRSSAAALFWRPAFAEGVCITPYPWIPNVKVLRLRDQYWKKWISVRRVLKAFKQLATAQ